MNPSLPEELDSQVIDLQPSLPFQFLTSLLRVRRGWFTSQARKMCATLVSIILAIWAAYLIAFHTIDPSFHVTATRGNGGAYRFDISPNFVVNTVDSVLIVGPNGKLVERNKQISGTQSLTVASGLAPNNAVTIECVLQYDRLAPSIAARAKTLILH